VRSKNAQVAIIKKKNMCVSGVGGLKNSNFLPFWQYIVWIYLILYFSFYLIWKVIVHPPIYISIKQVMLKCQVKHLGMKTVLYSQYSGVYDIIFLLSKHTMNVHSLRLVYLHFLFKAQIEETLLTQPCKKPAYVIWIKFLCDLTTWS
jgi:hypothetical protein